MIKTLVILDYNSPFSSYAKINSQQIFTNHTHYVNTSFLNDHTSTQSMNYCKQNCENHFEVKAILEGEIISQWFWGLTKTHTVWKSYFT